jgi:apolipoprotein D and lipocalin family protein
MTGRALVCALIVWGLAQGATPPASAPVVAGLNLHQYAGTYYEIARIPNQLQRECTAEVTTTYDVRPDGRLDVVNRCRREDGSVAEARGIGHASRDGSRIEVRFSAARTFWPFGRRSREGYSILGVGPDSSYAVIGDTRRNYLWILSRIPRMSELAYRQALEIAAAYGFDVDKLVRTSTAGDRQGQGAKVPECLVPGCPGARVPGCLKWFQTR